MKALLEFFPQHDFALIAVILALPLLGAFVNGVFGRRLGRRAVRLMALSVLGASFLAAVATFLALTEVVGEHHDHEKLSWTAWEWMRTSTIGDSAVAIDLKFSVDALSGVMMLVVTGVGFLIHVYASEYMAKDKAYWRFFAYLNLFVFSMLVLILGDNLPVLFVGWEGVGLCSYLLIGFWYDVSGNASAGKKAFIMNRIGDFGLICGMFLLVYYCGALDWTGISNNAQKLLTPNEAAQVHLWPIGGGQFQDQFIGPLKLPLSILQPRLPITITGATAVGLALFLGCTGKSAQLPLYTWLPDAMAGPTPVSALIHAATMVTAGIYLICRLSFVFVLSTPVMIVIAFTGALTALYAAVLALVQNDIKKVLAFSTVSQLGFMFLGVGVGAFTAGFFHVFTHAFFKACLFLGAGSVIHAMHARIHDDVRAQDMRNMGGLRKHMPVTFWTFVASTAAIIGVPFTSGFFSKDEILSHALFNQQVNPYADRLTKMHVTLWTPPAWTSWALWGMGVLAATLTAFYMCRCAFLTFGGKFRGWTVGRATAHSLAPEPLVDFDDDHGHGGHDHDDEHGAAEHDDHHHHEDLSAPGAAPHESPRAMTVPLIVLAALAIFGGLLNPGVFKIFSEHFDKLAMEKWLEPVFEEGIKGVAEPAHEIVHHRELISLGLAIAAFAVGTYLAYWMYVQQDRKHEPAYFQAATRVAAGFTGGLLVIIGVLIAALNGETAPAKLIVPGVLVAGGAALIWRNRAVGLDDAYDKSVVAGVDALADTAASVDQGVVDFVIARLSALLVSAFGTLFRVVQNGVVHVYAAMMVVGLAAIGWFFIVPHAEVSVQETNGDYTLSVAPGMGYGYKWYPDAAGEPQQKVWSGVESLKVHLDEGKSQTVKVEVRNAFGRTAIKEVKLARAKVEQPMQIQLGER